MTAVLVVCGSGGVGKTTVSAAIGVAHALAGRRVVVLTIDPARRLADALGLQQLGNEPTRVALEPAPGAQLYALMLDRKTTWDALVRDHAADASTVERLLANPTYQAISTRLSGGHEYMAIERLHALATSGDWDVVVVDTPPSQHAVDFFRAPERIRSLLDQRWLGALLRPGGGLVGMATRRVAEVVRRLAGDGMMADLQDFFALVGTLSERLRTHGGAVDALLRSPACRYLVVTSARAPRTDELIAWRTLLDEGGQHLHGVLLNRASPPLTMDETSLLAHIPAAEPWNTPAWQPAVEALQNTIRRAEASARTTAAARAEAALATSREVWTLPDLEAGVGGADDLVALARQLPPTFLAG